MLEIIGSGHQLHGINSQKSRLFPQTAAITPEGSQRRYTHGAEERAMPLYSEPAWVGIPIHRPTLHAAPTADLGLRSMWLEWEWGGGDRNKMTCVRKAGNGSRMGWLWFFIPSEKGSHRMVHKMPSYVTNHVLFEFVFFGIAYTSVLNFLYKKSLSISKIIFSG